MFAFPVVKGKYTAPAHAVEEASLPRQRQHTSRPLPSRPCIGGRDSAPGRGHRIRRMACRGWTRPRG
eukprot:7240079-Pyramimonas_sp.AAC.1